MSAVASKKSTPYSENEMFPSGPAVMTLGSAACVGQGESEKLTGVRRARSRALQSTPPPPSSICPFARPGAETPTPVEGRAPAFPHPRPWSPLRQMGSGLERDSAFEPRPGGPLRGRSEWASARHAALRRARAPERAGNPQMTSAAPFARAGDPDPSRDAGPAPPRPAAAAGAAARRTEAAAGAMGAGGGLGPSTQSPRTPDPTSIAHLRVRGGATCRPRALVLRAAGDPRRSVGPRRPRGSRGPGTQPARRRRDGLDLRRAGARDSRPAPAAPARGRPRGAKGDAAGEKAIQRRGRASEKSKWLSRAGVYRLSGVSPE